MPAATIENVTKREAALQSAVAGLGEDADPTKRRRLKKKLRRTQRKRRRLHVQEELKKGKPAEAKDD